MLLVHPRGELEGITPLVGISHECQGRVFDKLGKNGHIRAKWRTTILLTCRPRRDGSPGQQLHCQAPSPLRMPSTHHGPAFVRRADAHTCFLHRRHGFIYVARFWCRMGSPLWVLELDGCSCAFVGAAQAAPRLQRCTECMSGAHGWRAILAAA